MGRFGLRAPGPAPVPSPTPPAPEPSVPSPPSPVPSPAPPALAPRPTPRVQGPGLAGRLAPQPSGLPRTAAPPTPQTQTAYTGAKAQLGARGVQVQDNFAPHHDLAARTNTFQVAHEALAHAHDVLPAMSKLPALHGLQVHFAGAPQQTAAGQLHGQYTNPGTAPRLEVNDQSPQTLWHEYGHYLDHALNHLQGDASIGNLSSMQQGHPMKEFVNDLRQTDAHQSYINGELQKSLQSPGRDTSHAFYLGHPTEVFARFFNQYLNHTYAQKTGQQAPGGAEVGEQYSPEQLQQFGGRLRTMLSGQAVRLGQRFERAGPVQVATPGAEEVREAAWADQLPEGTWVLLGGPRGAVSLFVRESDRRIVAGPLPLLGADVAHILAVHAQQPGRTLLRHSEGAVSGAPMQERGLAINVSVERQGQMAAQQNYRRMAAGQLF